MSSAQNPPNVQANTESGKTFPVMVRLDEKPFMDMRKAMAEAGILTNQEFGAQAIAEKVAKVFGQQRGDDRRKGDRRAA